MLTLIVPKREFFDEQTNMFIYLDEQTLQLEHSLISISKWESRWHKSFFSNTRTREESLDYIKCMTITNNVKPIVYDTLSSSTLSKINKYIDDPMSATTFSVSEGPMSREIITSELVYYWMIKLGIPFECQKWHFNRLITLLRVCEIKEGPKKKMKPSEILSRNRDLNAQRRAKLNTKG